MIVDLHPDDIIPTGIIRRTVCLAYDYKHISNTRLVLEVADYRSFDEVIRAVWLYQKSMTITEISRILFGLRDMGLVEFLIPAKNFGD